MKLSGPFRLPTNNQKPKQLVIFLHGVGSNGHDLIELSDELVEVLPGAVFLSPNAPFPYDMYPQGYQWFSLLDRSAEKLYQGIQVSLPILKSYIDENLALYKLSYKELILVGFSQGTMIALQLALRLAESCFAVVGFSGALVKPEALINETKSRPPICLIHGEDDQVVPSVSHKLSVKDLKSLNIPLEEYLLPNLAHSINMQGLELAKKFLKNKLG